MCFPKIADAYAGGLVHTPNLRAVLTHLAPCGLDLLQAYEPVLLDLALRAGPREIHAFCRELAAVHRPDREQDKVRAQGSRLVRVHRLGALMHLDAMLDPVLGDRLKATLTNMVRQSRTPDDPRSHAERCADALEAVLRQGMDHQGCAATPAPARAARAHASVSVQLETLLGRGATGAAILARFGVIRPRPRRGCPVTRWCGW